MPTSARTTTSASAASAARSPTTSASSATSASKSPSSASPAPAPNQAEHTTRPPDPGRHLHPAPLTLHRVLPHAQLISIFRVRRLGVRVPPARHRFPRSRVGPSAAGSSSTASRRILATGELRPLYDTATEPGGGVVERAQ